MRIVWNHGYRTYNAWRIIPFVRDSVRIHFQKVDSVMYALASKYSAVEVRTSENYFSDLAETIVNQQLSEKAGATIWKRFLALFDHDTATPQLVKRVSREQLRNTGMSYAKAEYIHNLADAFVSKRIEPRLLKSLGDDAAVKYLSAVKGIGPWSAEMFLIFSLGREDVFSYGDAGLMRALHKLYGNGRKVAKRKMQHVVNNWSPYRSYACLLLWKSLDSA